MKWYIKNIEIKNRVVLAPMAGISNPTYMKIVEDMGCGLFFTELISAVAIVRNNEKTLKMLNGLEKIKTPVGIQLFGNDPKIMADAAKIVTNLYKNCFIDINMGCPVPKVAIKNNAGSALLKDPDRVYEIVSSVVKNINKPVSVKIRSGWDNFNINAVEIARKIEEAGASCICVHARTRSQGYSGVADWSIIKDVKENVSIPVIGNGDIKSPELALKMLKETNCDAIMIGRAALGNPWIIKDCIEFLDKDKVILKTTDLEKVSMMKKHFKMLCEDKNEKVALLEIRTNILYYLKGMPKSKEIKNLICNCKDKSELNGILNEYEKYLKELI